MNRGLTTLDKIIVNIFADIEDTTPGITQRFIDWVCDCYELRTKRKLQRVIPFPIDGAKSFFMPTQKADLKEWFDTFLDDEERGVIVRKFLGGEF